MLATLTCTRSDVLAPSASYPPITLTVNVAANAPANVVNTATVSGGGETNVGNNTSTVTTPVAPLLPDLTIVKVANGTFAQGQVGATYTLTVTNAGAGPTSAAVSVRHAAGGVDRDVDHGNRMDMRAGHADCTRPMCWQRRRAIRRSRSQ